MVRRYASILAPAMVLAVLPLITAPAAGQQKAAKAAPAKGAKWVHPETPWGDPDLQGVWPGNMGVPMQRPVDLGTKQYVSEEEFAERQARAAQQAKGDQQQQSTSDTRVGIGPPSYWTERGTPTRQTSLIVDPPNGRLPALTAAAADYRKNTKLPGEWRGEASSFEDLNIYYRCITRGLLGSVIPVVYNNGNQIVQAPGYVVFRNEMIHEARVIPLNGGSHVNVDIKTYMGDSRGHFEGNVLVVETTNLNNKVAIGSNGAGYPGDPGYHSTDIKVTERFERIDADTMQYRITVNDPKTWVQPWTILMEMKKDQGYSLLEYACHEGNYAMHDILSGARVEEGVLAPGASAK